MKRFLLTLVAFICLSSLQAQNYSVTFQVDMRAQVVSPSGVHVAGSFQAAAGYPADWDPATTALTDGDGDGIYDITVSIPAGTYNYKYINGNAWGADENAIPAACNVSGNREVVVTNNMTIPVHAYGICDPNPAGNPVIFQVDMKNETVSPNGVHVAGSFQDEAGFAADWDPATTALTNVSGTTIYRYVAWLNATGSYEFKYVNGNAWGGDEGVPAACATGGNRTVDVFNANGVTLPAVCFASCDPCLTGIPDTVYARAQVDMSIFNYPYAPYNQSIEQVSAAGTFQAQVGGTNWTPNLTMLTDPDGDKIYTAIWKLVKGTYQYKFVHTPNGGNSQWEDVPPACSAGGNREMNLMAAANGDTVDLPLVCYGSCVNACPVVGPPIKVTFLLDLNNTPPGPVGPYVAGSYQFPDQWQKTQDMMTETTPGSGIYTFVQNSVKPVRYEYKYFYGDTTGLGSNMDNIAEFNGATTSPGDCAGLNPFGQYNRILDLIGATNDTVLYAYEFSSCTYTVGIDEYLNSGRKFVIAPNPMTDYAEIRFSNQNNDAFQVTVTNITGQVVYSKADVRQTIELKRKDFQTGVYFVTIWNEKGDRATRKLIVE